MSILRDAMDALGDELAASVKRTARIEHRGTKGGMREEAVRKALRPHIPQLYELASGIVVNLDGRQSEQQDVIVSDAVENPSFIAEGGLDGVQPIEAVVATIEVKSIANPNAVRDAVSKAVSVAGLLPDEPRSAMKPGIGAQLVKTTQLKPFAGFVGLKANGSADSLVKAWTSAHDPTRPWDRLDAIVVVGEFFACWADAEGHWANLADPRADRVEIMRAGADSLLLFYVLMMLGIRDYPAPTLNLVQYVEAAGIDVDQEPYDPGISWETE